MSSKYKRLRDETVRSCRTVVRLASGGMGKKEWGK